MMDSYNRAELCELELLNKVLHDIINKVAMSLYEADGLIVLNEVTRQTMDKIRKKTSKSEHDWTPVKYLNVLHHNRTQKQSQQFFS